MSEWIDITIALAPALAYVVLVLPSPIWVACVFALLAKASLKQKLLYIFISAMVSYAVSQLLTSTVVLLVGMDLQAWWVARIVSPPLSALLVSYYLYKLWLQRPPNGR